jgi:hypothetical protein
LPYPAARSDKFPLYGRHPTGFIPMTGWLASATDRAGDITLGELPAGLRRLMVPAAQSRTVTPTPDCVVAGAETVAEQPEQAVDRRPAPALAAAVDLARAAAAQEAGDEPVGQHVGVQAEEGVAATHLFEADLPGYHGWRWAVTVADAGPDTPVTVSEVVLLPGPAALVAPAWVPWQQRVQAGDLGVGDLMPPTPDDPRIAPAYLLSDDPAVAEVARDIGLGRERVMSRFGRVDAAQRWQESDFGPDSDMARAAPDRCGTCAFYLPLAGSLRAAFGVCGNEISPADARVVHAGYGCGAHSEVEVTVGSPVPVADLVYDDTTMDLEPFRTAPEPRSGDSAAAPVEAVAAEPVVELAEPDRIESAVAAADGPRQPEVVTSLAAPDISVSDAGVSDAGVSDAGVSDAGVSDAAEVLDRHEPVETDEAGAPVSEDEQPESASTEAVAANTFATVATEPEQAQELAAPAEPEATAAEQDQAEATQTESGQIGSGQIEAEPEQVEPEQVEPAQVESAQFESERVNAEQLHDAHLESDQPEAAGALAELEHPEAVAAAEAATTEPEQVEAAPVESAVPVESEQPAAVQPEPEAEAEAAAAAETEAMAEVGPEAPAEARLEAEPQDEAQRAAVTPAEVQPEAQSEPEIRAESEAPVEAEPEARSEAAALVEAEPEPAALVQPEPEPAASAEPEAQAPAEAGTPAEVQPGTQPEPEIQAEPEAATEVEPEAEAQPEPEPQPEAEPQLEAETPTAAENPTRSAPEPPVTAEPESRPESPNQF